MSYQAFVRNRLDSVISLPTQSYPLHQSRVFKRLHTLADEWDQSPAIPTVTQDASFIVDNVHEQASLKKQLTIPSKLHVLCEIWKGHCEQQMDASNTWVHLTSTCSPKLQENLERKLQVVSRLQNQQVPYSDEWVSICHWFQHSASNLFFQLGQPDTNSYLNRLDDALIQWCCQQWQTYPNIYDYFVPLDVQYAYETKGVCTYSIDWEWYVKRSLGKSQWTKHICAPRKYTLRTHVPSISLNPNIVRDLSFRITVMSLLERQPCKHVVLQWFPVDRRKLAVHAKINRIKSLNSLRGTKRKQSSSRRSFQKKKPHVSLCIQDLPSSRKDSHIWTPYEINTGATYRKTCNSVTLWRREEAPKTFLHELMHGFGWDFDHPEHLIQSWVVQHFQVDPKIEIRFYESYVETWATLLNVCFVHRQSGNLKDVDTLQAMVDDERRFSVFQAAKVLCLSGFKQWTHFFNDQETVKSKSSCVFRQTTSVFSYYILRAILLWDIDWFLKHFVTLRYYSCGVVTSSEWYTQWLQQLSQISSNEHFCTAIDSCIALLTNERMEDDIRFTMRMTCIES